MKTTLIMFFLLISFLPNIFAEHLPHFSIEGHTGDVTNLAFSPDGETLASAASWDNTIRLWDINTGQQKHVLTLHEHDGANLAFSPDGETLASVSWNETIRLWDVNTGQQKHVFRGPTGFFRSLVFSPDGETLASAGRDGTIRLWDVNTRQQKQTLQHIYPGYVVTLWSLAFSPDGKTLASGAGNINLWDVNTGQRKHVFEWEGHSIRSLAFSPDGQILATGSALSALSIAAELSPSIHLWDVRTATHIATLTGHETSIVSVVFSPDGQTLASASPDRTVRLWDVATRKPKKTFALLGNVRYVRNVVFSPDGKTLANTTGGKAIHLWDTVSGQHKYDIFEHLAADVAFSPDGKTLVSGGARIILWDSVTRHQKMVLSESGDVAFSPDGQLLATANKAGPIRLWDPNTGKRQKTLTLPTHTNNPSIDSILFSPDGQTLASGGDGLTLWNVNNGSVKAWRRFSASALSFSPDGRMLATTTLNKIQLWDANTLQHKYNIDKPSHANGFVFSPDGWIITFGGAVSPDGRTVARRNSLWDANSKHLKLTFTARDRLGINQSNVAFSPDGRTIAGATPFNTIGLWKLPDTRVSITPYPVASPAIGEQFTVNLSIVEGQNVGGYQLTVGFDETLLRYVESANGNYLPLGSFFVPPVVSEKSVTLSATSLTGTSSGDGTLASVTFEVLQVKESPIALFDLILTDSTGSHLSVLTNSGRIDPTLSSTSEVVDLTPSSVLSPAIGEQLVFNIRISGGQNVAGYQISLQYDKNALKPVLASNGVYIPDASPEKPFVSEGLVTLGTSSTTGVGNGDGVLATITFETLVVQASTVNVSGYLTAANGLRSTPIFKGAEVIVAHLGDVNRDGTVNILDLVLVSSSFGKQVSEDGNPADVNEDGIINIVDLVTVAGAIKGGAAAPSLHPQALDAFTAADVQQWLAQAQHMELNDAISQRGLRFLEQLLAALIPKETALLANYPNPFNPETWIPYQLAKPAEVTLTIYTVDGTVVRTLALGHKAVGIYQNKTRAAYWDGRNEVGEFVASGLYFYTLTTGDFTATRKMLILK